MAAAPVLAAAEAVQAVKPSAAPTFSYPSVPPAAVDSAVNQIIAAVKVSLQKWYHLGEGDCINQEGVIVRTSRSQNFRVMQVKMH